MFVSVIIPTYNRAQSLRRTLDSLAEQSYPSHGYETIVVDDGSSDETPAVVDQEFPFRVRYIRQRNQGAAVARNLGAEQSQADLLVFVDDDITLGQQYVDGLVDAHRSYDQIIGMGTLYPDASEHNSVFAKVYAERIARRVADNQGEFVGFEHCVTNNLSVEREAFLDIGMMQDVGGDGPTWWGDVDLGYRAHKAGYRFRRSRRAVCYHRDYAIRDLNTACEHAKQVYRVAPLLLRKYPDVQHHLRVFRDKTPISLLDDPPALVMNKLFHIFAAWPLVETGMTRVARAYERFAPRSALLWVLYRWIISSYIYRGYREGLRQYGRVPTASRERESADV